MKRIEHLLWILAEESAEVAQRSSKAARFGLSEKQPGQLMTNAGRIAHEIHDLLGIVEMLVEAGAIAYPNDRGAIDDKKAKVERYLLYSRQCGTLSSPDK